MPQGLQTFDANGNIVVDISYRVGRYVGQFYMSNNPVTITSDAFLKSTVFITCLFAQVPFVSAPIVTQNGNTVTFTPSTNPNGTVGWVFYGVY